MLTLYISLASHFTGILPIVTDMKTTCDCHNVGFDTFYIGGKAYTNAYFGTGSGQIFLDDVQCSSSSSQLLECYSRPILSHNCLHSADAGVGCEGMFFN